MLSILWNYLLGYVIIEVRGFSIERFLNLISKKGIFIWDLTETQRGAEMKVSVKDFKKLKPYTKKSKCHIKIKGRFGRPFIIKSLKKRQLYILGIIVFIVSLYTLSSFIWLIEVSGNSRIKTKDILSFCESKGFSVGSYKSSIDTDNLKKELKNHFPEISWITIEMKGTKASIELRETLPIIKNIDASEPCDIAAKEDAIIESIITKRGSPLVKKGDAVSKGDILVSGELLISEDENGTVKNYTHSFAEIKGKITRKMTASVPFKYNEKIYSGKEENLYNLELFGKKLKIYNPETEFENYDTYNSLGQLKITDDYPLPLILITTTYKEFYYKEKVRTVDEAKKRGEILINKQILETFDFNTDIINKSYVYEKTDKELIITAYVTVISDIGEEQKIERSTSN